MRSRMMGLLPSHSVSPVVMFFRPDTATMSPVRATAMSSRLLACMSRILEMRSLLPLLLFSAYVPCASCPLQHRPCCQEQS